MDLGLAGKKAIIVGGARGIGYAIAEVLAREGCDLAVSARSGDAVKDAVASLKRYDVRVGRAARRRQEARRLSQVAGEGGRAARRLRHPDPDHLGRRRASAARNIGRKRSRSTSWAQCARSMPSCRTWPSAGGGSIVLIATTSAGEAMGGPQPYNAMKASLVTWGKQLALAHGKDGIRVNVVSPGPIEFEGGNWEMIKDTMTKFYDATLRQQPQGRFGKPEEIARCVAFIASPAASWVNGSHLIVDGGFTNRTHF